MRWRNSNPDDDTVYSCNCEECQTWDAIEAEKAKWPLLFELKPAKKICPCPLCNVRNKNASKQAN